jgi:hypothetical protein
MPAIVKAALAASAQNTGSVIYSFMLTRGPCDVEPYGGEASVPRRPLSKYSVHSSFEGQNR